MSCALYTEYFSSGSLDTVTNWFGPWKESKNALLYRQVDDTLMGVFKFPIVMNTSSNWISPISNVKHVLDSGLPTCSFVI